MILLILHGFCSVPSIKSKWLDEYFISKSIHFCHYFSSTQNSYVRYLCPSFSTNWLLTNVSLNNVLLHIWRHAMCGVTWSFRLVWTRHVLLSILINIELIQYTKSFFFLDNIPCCKNFANSELVVTLYGD